MGEQRHPERTRRSAEPSKPVSITAFSIHFSANEAANTLQLGHITAN
jgi:hypothetical protein